ncbi:MAG: hypothetical protein AAF533_25190 [Acidobacteriota bacterium]
MLKIKSGDGGLLSVTFTAGDPVVAAFLANELIEEAQEASKAIERQLLLQQAGHVGKALDTARIRLADVEERLRVFSAKHALLDPGLQAADRIRQVRELESLKGKFELQVTERLLSHTPNEPGVRALRRKIGVIENQVDSLEQNITGDVSQREYGQLAIEHRGLTEELRFRRDLCTTLSTQADVFRIRAEQPAGNLAIIRPAVPVTKPAGPSKTKHVGVGLGLGCFLGCGLVILLEQVAVMRRKPTLARRLDELWEHVIRPPWRPRPAAR